MIVVRNEIWGHGKWAFMEIHPFLSLSPSAEKTWNLSKLMVYPNDGFVMKSKRKKNQYSSNFVSHSARRKSWIVNFSDTVQCNCFFLRIRFSMKKYFLLLKHLLQRRANNGEVNFWFFQWFFYCANLHDSRAKCSLLR